MKQVLVIDESPLLREYLRLKLTEYGLEAHIAINGLDGITKIRNLVPDLVILDYQVTRKGIIELLEEKKKSPNTANIPVIVTTQLIDQRKILELVKYNVKKVFAKPIKIDALFKTMSELLGVAFDVDDTPCIIEAHVNDDILFIEIAQGLNREKMDLLRFKMVELLDLYEIRTPKILVMMSDVKLGYADGPNVEKLLETITGASKAKHKHIRILTRDSFLPEFVKGQKEFADIEVVSNLQYAMDGLLSQVDANRELDDTQASLIGDRILKSTADGRAESVQLKFDAETKKGFSIDDVKAMGKELRIAAVDDDFVIQELMKATFGSIGAAVTTFSDGSEFLAVAGNVEFDLVFLDLLMPKVSGFDVLKELKNKDIHYPIIVLSAVTSRDAVVKAFQAGVKSYLTKPLQPTDILKKAVEILKPNF